MPKKKKVKNKKIIYLVLIFALLFGLFPIITKNKDKYHDETYNQRLVRCGDFPYKDGIPSRSGGFVVVSQKVWSPDCMFITWAVNNSGTVVINSDKSGIAVKSNEEEGVFIYSIEDQKIEKIPLRITQASNFSVLDWDEIDSLVFSYTISGKVNKRSYNIYTKKISSN